MNYFVLTNNNNNMFYYLVRCLWELDLTMLGNFIPFGWIKVANAFTGIFKFRFLSQSCFIYINLR